MSNGSENIYTFSRNQVYVFVSGALTFVAGLAWNDAIQTIFNRLIPDYPGLAIYGKFLYAIIVTLVIIAILYILYKLTGKTPEQY